MKSGSRSSRLPARTSSIRSFRARTTDTVSPSPRIGLGGVARLFEDRDPLVEAELRGLGLFEELFERGDEAQGGLDLRQVADALENLEPAAGDVLVGVFAVVSGDDRVL